MNFNEVVYLYNNNKRNINNCMNDHDIRHVMFDYILNNVELETQLLNSLPNLQIISFTPNVHECSADLINKTNVPQICFRGVYINIIGAITRSIRVILCHNTTNLTHIIKTVQINEIRSNLYNFDSLQAIANNPHICLLDCTSENKSSINLAYDFLNKHKHIKPGKHMARKYTGLARQNNQYILNMAAQYKYALYVLIARKPRLCKYLYIKIMQLAIPPQLICKPGAVLVPYEPMN